MAKSKNIDHLLRDWDYRFGEVLARKVYGSDKRELIQMRIDLGVLQLEVNGRPDGNRPGGFDSYYDYLLSLSFSEGDRFTITPERCAEIDREFVQYYYRRISWMALREFDRAVKDADHTLSLMNFASANSTDEEWVDLHEQYRPFVIFHRAQAASLSEIDRGNPRRAVSALDKGLEQIFQFFKELRAEEHYETDDFVIKLRDMRESLIDHFGVAPSLAEQLTQAIASEQYELAAELRDKISSSQTDHDVR